MSNASKIGFIVKSARRLTQGSIICPPDINPFNKMTRQIQLVKDPKWQNEKLLHGEEGERYMKPSRREFLRKKQVSKYRYNRLICYVSQNYEALREASRQKSAAANNRATLNSTSEWLGY